MTYGLKIHTAVGELALHSEISTYTLAQVYTGYPNNAVASFQVPSTITNPPLLFVRVGSSPNPEVGFIDTYAKWNATDNKWDIHVQIWPFLCLPDSRQLLPEDLICKVYVFTQRTSTSECTGYGLQISNLATVCLSTTEKPLVIKKRVYLDQNYPEYAETTPSQDSTHNTSISLGTPQGEWAIMFGRLLDRPNNFWDLWDSTRWMCWSDFTSVGYTGPVAYINKSDTSNHILTTPFAIHDGPICTTEQISGNGYTTVWAIDTYWYDL